MISPNPWRDPLTLAQAKQLVRCLASEQALLLLSSPGVGKSALVQNAAAEAGLEVRTLLGTQIAPEDVSGVPRIVGQRTVFCPPRLLLPEDHRPYCLFLDELPAAPAEVQKAFYSLLLERRIGENHLPTGCWGIAAGNTSLDRTMVRMLSSALINRVFVLPIRVDVAEWLAWAEENHVRADVRDFIQAIPQALQRPVPSDPIPFSTPRSWTQLSTDLTLAECAGRSGPEERRAMVFGRVSATDAALFCVACESGLAGLESLERYLDDPGRMPDNDTALWFIVSRFRQAVRDGRMKQIIAAGGNSLQGKLNNWLLALPEELRLAAMTDLVEAWDELGSGPALWQTFKEVTGL